MELLLLLIDSDELVVVLLLLDSIKVLSLILLLSYSDVLMYDTNLYSLPYSNTVILLYCVYPLSLHLL